MKLFLYVLTQVCITLVSVCGIYILTGLTGMFSLGSAAFMAIGAYVSGLLVLKAGLNMYAAFRPVNSAPESVHGWCIRSYRCSEKSGCLVYSGFCYHCDSHYSIFQDEQVWTTVHCCEE